MLKLHQQEIEYLIEPPKNTIIEQLGGRQESPLLDGFMPTAPHMEDVIEKMLEDRRALAITITYKPRYQMCEEDIMRKILISNLAWIHNHIDISYTLGLVPDEDVNGNYHYHGVIVIKMKDIKKFKKYITMFNGYMKTSYIEDTNKWKEYVMKSYTGRNPKRPEQIFTLDEIDRLGIVYDC